MLNWLLSTVCLAAAVAACAENSTASVQEALMSPARIERVEDVLHYEGAIMPGDAARVRALLDGVKTVIINSSGGDGPESIEIGKAFAEIDGLQLRVSDWCLSGCAQFVFVAAKQKIVERGGVLACHHNPFALDRIDRTLWEKQAPPDYQDFLDDARALYAQLGVSEEYGMVCMIGQGLACVEGAGAPKAAFKTVFHFFVPTLEQLQRFGIENVRFEEPPLKKGEMRNGFGTFVNYDYRPGSAELMLRDIKSCEQVRRDGEALRERRLKKEETPSTK